jgi:hypothetical protein
MPEILDLSNEAWLYHKPPKHRDVRKLFSGFWTLSEAIEERSKRVSILASGGTRELQKLEEVLAEAVGRAPSTVGCCPVVARRFQVFFTSRALKVARRQEDEGLRYTFLDKDDAVPFGQLHSVEWVALHLKFRRRLERHLGSRVVVYGMGEVEADDSRGVWQPHYHVTIHGATDARLKALRKAHYRAKRTGIRPMVRSKPQLLEGWLAYASKMVAFDKIPTHGGPSSRCRLPPELSREYFQYLAARRPTSFVFSMNCRIVKGSLRT